MPPHNGKEYSVKNFTKFTKNNDTHQVFYNKCRDMVCRTHTKKGLYKKYKT